MPYGNMRIRKEREDKRRAVRVAIEDVTVEIYTPEGETGVPEICDIVNISEGGLLFKCTRSYQVSQALRLTFLVPASMISIRTDAVVVHERVDLSGRYVGVRFAKLGISELASLQSFVKHRCDN